MNNQEDYVTYTTAKLLKAAGYPQEYKRSLGEALIVTDDGALCRPSLWDAMKWLREEKKLFVETRIDLFGKYNWGVCDLANSSNDMASEQWDLSYTTYEAACDAGIAVACEWLIAHATNDESKTE